MVGQCGRDLTRAVLLLPQTPNVSVGCAHLSLSSKHVTKPLCYPHEPLFLFPVSLLSAPAPEKFPSHPCQDLGARDTVWGCL